MSGRFDWPGMGAEAPAARPAARAAAPREVPAHLPDETVEDEPEIDEKKVHISWGRILKWTAIIGGLFGAGYVLRGWADSTNGTANLLSVLKGRREEGGGHELSGLAALGLVGGGAGGLGMGGLGRPPSPEELAYWSMYYRRGAQALGDLPPVALPRLPTVEQVPMPPASRQELAAERALLSSPKPRQPRYPWGGGMGGGFQEDYYGPSPFGGGGYTQPGSDDEFVIIKE